MGSYSSFHIGDREVYSVKNDIDPLLMSLFRPYEKEVTETTCGDYWPGKLVNDDDSSHPLVVVRYRSTAGCIRDRLDLLGFSLAFAERVFDQGIRKERLDLARLAQQFGPDLNIPGGQDQHMDVLNRITMADWMAGFRYILNHKLPESRHALTPYRLGDSLEDQPFAVEYMLSRNLVEFYGHPTFDTRVFLRAALEAVDATETVCQDLTDLVAGGWFDSAEDLNAHADYLVTADFVTTQRIIVLTEGATDKRVLEGALSLRRPHLRDYFSFIDFEELKVPGGAASVISFVKAFVGAGIQNRVVAVLDNDTAALSATRALRGLTLPPNVRVVHLPRLEHLQHYPTIGPTGVSAMDINGLGASIELYFGADVLTQLNGDLTPVQWRGYDEALKQYQGEVLKKAALQASFREKLSQSLSVTPPQALGDWSAIDSILDTLCGAFLSSPAEYLDDEDS